MTKFLKGFERVVVYVLLALMSVVILLAIVDLGRIIYTDIFSFPYFQISIDDLLKIFGFVLLIVIGVELLETIKAYLSEHIVHVEIVIEVALIAVARKVIILDVKDLPPLSVFGIASLILVLSVGYYLQKRTRRLEGQNQNNSDGLA